jgi:hypothetical protein
MGWRLDGEEDLVGKPTKLTLAAFDQIDVAAPLLQL